MGQQDRNKELDSDSNDSKFNVDFKRLLRDFKSDIELWDFLNEHSATIFGIKNWEKYRRSTESVAEYGTSNVSTTDSNDLILFYREFDSLLTDLGDFEDQLIESGVQLDPTIRADFRDTKRFLDEIGSKIRHAIISPYEVMLDLSSNLSRIKVLLNKVIEFFTQQGRSTPALERLMNEVVDFNNKLIKIMNYKSKNDAKLS